MHLYSHGNGGVVSEASLSTPGTLMLAHDLDWLRLGVVMVQQSFWGVSVSLSTLSHMVEIHKLFFLIR